MCAFAYSFVHEGRKGMHIIVKPSEKIKQFRVKLECTSTISKQSVVATYYVNEVMRYQRYKEEHPGLFAFSSSGLLLPASIVQSSTNHSYIIGPDKDDEIDLKLYEILSRSPSKGDKHRLHERVLVEPFYPRFHVPLDDIYNILREDPATHKEGTYRYKSAYDDQQIRRLRRTFREQCPSIFAGSVLCMSSFEKFYEFIHHMGSADLAHLFGTPVLFVNN